MNKNTHYTEKKKIKVVGQLLCLTLRSEEGGG